MRDLGVRITRQKLLRYRSPDPPGRRFRKWLVLGVLAFLGWALLLSEHSASRLLKLQAERSALQERLAVAEEEVRRAESELPGPNPSADQVKVMLNQRHNYVAEDQIIYVFGQDSTAVR